MERNGMDGKGGVWSPVIPRHEGIPAGSMSDGRRPKGRVRFNNEPFPVSLSFPPPHDPSPVPSSQRERLKKIIYQLIYCAVLSLSSRVANSGICFLMNLCGGFFL